MRWIALMVVVMASCSSPAAPRDSIVAEYLGDRFGAHAWRCAGAAFGWVTADGSRADALCESDDEYDRGAVYSVGFGVTADGGIVSHRVRPAGDGEILQSDVQWAGDRVRGWFETREAEVAFDLPLTGCWSSSAGQHCR